MALNIPETAQEIESRAKADVKSSAPLSNPFLRNSWLSSLITAYCNRIFDFYDSLRFAQRETFFDTSTGDRLKTQASWFGVEQLKASQATGFLVVTGEDSSSVPVGTEFKTQDGISFITDVSGTISANTLGVAEITRSGTTVTANTTSPHDLANGVEVTIAGADQTEYNVTASITVVDEDTFEYEISGTPVSPGTGSITASSVSARVKATSVPFGDSANLDPGESLTISQSLPGVDDTATVDAGGTRGGADLESQEDLRDRFLFRTQNPVAHFNETDIISKAREVAGVTRVFVEKAGTTVGSVSVSSITRSGSVAQVITTQPHGFENGNLATISGANEAEYNVVDERVLVEDDTTFYFLVVGAPSTPASGSIDASLKIPAGQCRVYFMRDNDTNPIPDAAEVAEVHDKIFEIVPANTVDEDVQINAPISQEITFDFASITPDTTSMRNSVAAQLNSLFSEFIGVSEGLTEDNYKNVIYNTIDTETGQRLTNFVLNSPSGPINGVPGNILVLKEVQFS